MGILQVGELAAMGTALLWTFSALIWTSTGRQIGSLPTSFLRLVLTCGFLVGYQQLLCGRWLPTDASAETWILLGASGLAGFFLADVCLFKALVLIGPRLTLLLQSLTPPLTAVIAAAFLDEQLDGKDWLAMAVTLTGVTWVVLERPNGRAKAHPPGQLRQGVVLAVLAAIAQAVGMVLARDGIGDYDAVAATYIRVLGAMIGYVVLISLARRWRAIRVATYRGGIMVMIASGAFIGPFLGVVLCMIALRHCHAGVAATIVSTTPVLILPFVIFLHHEDVSLRAAGGAVLSVLGVALLVL
ncbi:MAG: DMT family transporter [Pirellulales bacterium]|nr:DMT family transporter [Pirellulales bacterium]